MTLVPSGGHRLPARCSGSTRTRRRAPRPPRRDPATAAETPTGSAPSCWTRRTTASDSAARPVASLLPGPRRPAAWAADRRPQARTGGRTSYVDQVCLDIPPSRYDDELAFWADRHRVAAARPSPGSTSSPADAGPRSSRSSCCCSGSTTSRARSPPTSTGPRPTTRPSWPRTRRAGAEVQARFERWTVMRDPAGLTYCVTDVDRETGRVNDEIGNLIRPMTEEDWPQIWPFFDEIVQAGETYAYPPDLTCEQARDLWLDERARPDRRARGATARSSAAPPWARTGPAAAATSAPRRSWSPRRPAAVASAARLAEYVVQWHRDQGFRGDPVQRGRRDQHGRRTPVAVAGLRDHRHRAGGVRLTGARAGRPARDVPGR